MLVSWICCSWITHPVYNYNIRGIKLINRTKPVYRFRIVLISIHNPCNQQIKQYKTAHTVYYLLFRTQEYQSFIWYIQWQWQWQCLWSGPTWLNCWMGYRLWFLCILKYRSNGESVYVTLQLISQMPFTMYVDDIPKYYAIIFTAVLDKTIPD